MTTLLRAHYFQHVPFEGLGSIEAWLSANDYTISATQFWSDGYTLPDVDDIDFLIAMGGPMSVNDETTYPWLAAEKQFIREFIDGGKPVLGICLGAQLIASSLGAAVYPNKETEIGWYPVFGHPYDATDIFQFPDEQLVFHWHGETFDLPDGATLLASSYGCKNQGFQLGNNIVGLQFHLETTPVSAQDLVKFCGDELVSGDYIQSAGQILFAPDANYGQANALMERILQHITV